MKEYNIIWVDDQVLELTDGIVVTKLLNQFGIKIIAKCVNAQQFKEALDALCGVRIDAVITDANFPYKEFSPDKDRDISGLVKITTIMSRPEFCHIPCFLFSGRPDLCKEHEELLEEFERNQHYYNKNTQGIKPLLEAIIKEVDYLNTPEFQVDNNYRAALDAAQYLDDFLMQHTQHPSGEKARLFVTSTLIKCYDPTSVDFKRETVTEIFTSARKVIEGWVTAIKKLKIIPDNLPLNSTSRLLYDRKFIKEEDDQKVIFQLRTEVVPPALARALWYALDISQDGSHYRDDLRLYVDSYVTNIQNVNLVMSILFIIIDLLLWFKQYAPANSNKEINRLKWDIETAPKNH